mmetsp:Transcript_86717/g.173073  ORF Transcript_86717/g.173073 Transcript_86717/m.173073 type:complete len:128 (-) Transcript_86717:457-840(-)
MPASAAARSVRFIYAKLRMTSEMTAAASVMAVASSLASSFFLLHLHLRLLILLLAVAIFILTEYPNAPVIVTWRPDEMVFLVIEQDLVRRNLARRHFFIAIKQCDNSASDPHVGTAQALYPIANGEA